MPRYMWGIGFACSLVLLAFAGSWVIKGEFAYTSSKLGEETVTMISKSKDPGLFWAVIGFAFVVGGSGLVITSRGHHHVQQNESNSKA
ncbi:MAG: hypothetical protein SynsKO_42340 [Synoicihabitans sp.]